MDQTTITCTDTGIEHSADILSKHGRYMKVAIEGTDVTIKLTKSAPTDQHYVGRNSGLEFISTGD